MTDGLPIDTLQRLNAVCDDFERKLRSNQNPRIEFDLEAFDEPERSTLLASLLDVELYYQRANQQLPTLDQLIRRFPDHPDIVTRALFRCCARKDSDSTHNGPSDNSVVPPPALPAGTRLGRYTVRLRLGVGAFGDVYLAYDEQNRPYAVKTLHPQAQTDHNIAAFLTEARHLHQLSQAISQGRFAALHEIDQSDPARPFCVMEYINGESLRQRLNANTLTLREGMTIVAKVAEAVDAMHRCHIYHRDLKPGNVLIDAGDEPWVVDFGLAIHEQQQRSHVGQLAGTLAYMAPEQVRGEINRIDGRADIWALGAILYEVLTGRQPFSGTCREQLVEEILQRDPRPPRQIVGAECLPAELDTICSRALAKRPRDRYATARDFADAIWQVLETNQLDDSHAAPRSWTAYYERRLAHAANRWRDEPGINRLPGPLDVLGILCMTRRRPWSAAQTRMMHSAIRFYGLSLAMVILLTTLVAPAAWHAGERIKQERIAAAVQRLGDADSRIDLPQRMDDVRQFGPAAEPHLKKALAASLGDVERERRYRLALIAYEPDQLRPIVHEMLNAAPHELRQQWQLLLEVARVDAGLIAEICCAELECPSATRAGRYLYWPPCAPATASLIESAGGTVEGCFAFCQSLSLDEFAHVDQQLAASRYRLHRWQPYRHGDQRLAAAIWLRDGGQVAALSTYAAVAADWPDGRWLGPPAPASSAVDVPVPLSEKKAHYRPALLAVRLEEVRPDFFEDIPGLYHVELRWSPHSISLQNLFAQQDAFAKRLHAVRPDDPAVALLLGRAAYSREDYEQACHWFTQTLRSDKYREYALPFRARAFAFLGRMDEAAADLDDLRQHLQSAGKHPVWIAAFADALDAKLAAIAGDYAAAEAALQRIEALDDTQRPRSVPYYAAWGYATLAEVRHDSKPAAEQAAHRSVELLAQSIAAGMPVAEVITTRDFDILRHRDDFRRLVPPLFPTYEACWADDAADVILNPASEPDLHFKKCRAALAEGYEPSSISVLPGQDDNPPLVCSVWRNHAWQATDDLQTTRWANAAAVLMRIGEDQRVQHLLDDCPHNALRLALQTRLAELEPTTSRDPPDATRTASH